MRHYVMEKYTDLIGWIQYSPLQALYDVSGIIFELKKHIVPICIVFTYEECVSYIAIFKVESLGEMHYILSIKPFTAPSDC